MSTENSHSDWWTPRELIKVLDEEFHFDLDAAASEANHICPRYITEEMDALKTPWIGNNVWCNPPYGKGYVSSIPEFTRRAYEQHLEQKNTIVLLLSAYTDPRYFRDYCTKAHEIRMLTGRLAFLEGGVSRVSARFPSMLVIFKHFPGACYKAPHIWTWDWRVKEC